MQRFGRRALLLNCALLSASAFLCPATFAPGTFLKVIGISEEITKLILGAAGALVFALSIVELRVDWQHVSKKHAEAAAKLATLKSKYRGSRALQEEPKKVVETALALDYVALMEALPSIPDRWFAKLKLEHRFKRELSRVIDDNPTAPLWALKLLLKSRGFRALMKRNAANEND